MKNELPPPCNDNIFRNGRPIALVNGNSTAIEKWVVSIAKTLQVAIDWHFSGGIGQILFLGTTEERSHIIHTMKEKSNHPGVTILQLFEEDVPGLYRQNVTEVPEGAVASYYTGSDHSEYIYEKKAPSS